MILLVFSRILGFLPSLPPRPSRALKEEKWSKESLKKIITKQ